MSIRLNSDCLVGAAARCLCENDLERPLDLPQQRVATSGLDDGSFDPGEIVLGMPGARALELARVEDGWTHQPSFWGDDSKVVPENRCPHDLARAEMEDAAAWNGLVDEVRTTHFFGVEEEHEVNLIGLTELVWQAFDSIGLHHSFLEHSRRLAVIGDTATLRFAVAMRTMGSGSTSQVRIESAGNTESFYDQILTPSTLLYARYLPRNACFRSSRRRAGTDDL